MDIKTLRETAMREGMKLMSDPRVMKMMQDPRFMKVMMKAFQLRGEMQTAVEKQGKKLARTFKFATRDEVDQLKSTIRSLERNLETVQSQVKQQAAARATTP